MDFLNESDNPYILSDESKLELNRRGAIFNQIVGDWTYEIAKNASKAERTSCSIKSSTFVYGEIDFYSIGEVFETIKNRYGGIPSGGVFYDLGSGSGKCVIAAALLHNFQKCVGLELLHSLYDISLNMKEKYDEIIGRSEACHAEVIFENVDMFERGWADADFIFANSTCYSPDMMRRISDFPVKIGTWILTTSWVLESSKWTVHETITKKMSWGEATVYIQQKISN
ncbi:unnamed protein product [Blepharisma stoltei]|uniref:Histone-lysine N-methyltransferase, H3 lysine-79 specific n=1 Tax=Blepharisma stoltei TaxID=1481888 RepID=A0AAU9JQS4_9CILI|nr:unnamed protein product [Blepharisma stoltei]